MGRAKALCSLLLICCATTGAGVLAAMWLDSTTSGGLRAPASEPGQSITEPMLANGRRLPGEGPALPVYSVGDSFDFSVSEPGAAGGEPVLIKRRYVVSAVHGDRIEWTIGKNSSTTTTKNPLAPAISWRATEEGEGSRQLFGDPLALFPLKKGGKFQISSVARVGGLRDQWSCETEGQEQITVAAGSFRAWHIECSDQAGASKETYYFAEEVGFWVSRLSHGMRGTEPIERVYELEASNRLRR